MSTDRDTTRIVRSWLEMDESDCADRVLGAVLDRLDTTPQRGEGNTLADRSADAVTTLAAIEFRGTRGVSSFYDALSWCEIHTPRVRQRCSPVRTAPR